MDLKKLYIGYGLTLLVSGLLGFWLTHAKSALISGTASAVVIILLAFFTTHSKTLTWIPVGVNLVLALVFSWRFILVYQALSTNPEKTTAAIFLGIMGLASFIALYLGFVENNLRK